MFAAIPTDADLAIGASLLALAILVFFVWSAAVLVWAAITWLWRQITRP